MPSPSLYALTRDLHHKAETHPFAEAMLAGDISWQEWADWCGGLMRVHEQLDRHLPHALQRSEQIAMDLCALLPIRPRHLGSVTDYLATLEGRDEITGAAYIWCASHLRGGAIIRKRLEPRGMPCAHLRFADARAANDEIVRLRSCSEGADGARRAFHAVMNMMDEIEERRHRCPST